NMDNANTADVNSNINEIKSSITSNHNVTHNSLVSALDSPIPNAKSWFTSIFQPFTNVISWFTGDAHANLSIECAFSILEQIVSLLCYPSPDSIEEYYNIKYNNHIHIKQNHHRHRYRLDNCTSPV